MFHIRKYRDNNIVKVVIDDELVDNPKALV
jgi:hypothetical protein